MIRSAADARVRLGAFIATARAEPLRWAGAAETTQLRVLTALVKVGLHAGKVRIGCSYRQVAETAGIAIGTVRAALLGLEGEWIRVLQWGHRRRSKQPTVVQLLVDVPRVGVPSVNGAGGFLVDGGNECSFVAREFPTDPAGRVGTGLADPGTEVWRRRGAAWRIWCALRAADQLGETRSTAELVEGLGIPRRTVYRNLAWLAANDLVVKVQGRWTAAVEESPAQVVERLKLVPNSEIRDRHRLEQERHRLRLRISGLRGWWREAAHHEAAQIGEIQARINSSIAEYHTVEGQLIEQRRRIRQLRDRERAAARRRLRAA